MDAGIKLEGRVADPDRCPIPLPDLEADLSLEFWPETDCSKKSDTVPAIMPVWRSANTRFRVGMQVQSMEELRINWSQIAGIRACQGLSWGSEVKRGSKEFRPAVVRARTLF
jgi:hypothetical protein